MESSTEVQQWKVDAAKMFIRDHTEVRPIKFKFHRRGPDNGYDFRLTVQPFNENPNADSAWTHFVAFSDKSVRSFRAGNSAQGTKFSIHLRHLNASTSKLGRFWMPNEQPTIRDVRGEDGRVMRRTELLITDQVLTWKMVVVQVA